MIETQVNVLVASIDPSTYQESQGTILMKQFVSLW